MKPSHALVASAVAATAFAALSAFAGPWSVPTPFSSAAPGAGLPPGWRAVAMPHAAPAAIALESDNGTTVLRIRADAAASSVGIAARTPGETARVHWRWKVDRVVDSADLDSRAGDDYAARFYVTFDVPLERLSFVARARIRIARFLYGQDLPIAALCYVWDNRHPVGTTAWNAYSDQVRMVVLQSGPEHAGRWMEEERDVAADWRAAFGTRWPGPVPPVSGVALSADTDQTGERVTAWFADVRYVGAP